MLLFIGDGPERKNLEQLTKKLNLDAIFVGNVPHNEVSWYYSAMDVFIFPLNSIAIKLGEIQSVGLPLIVIKGMAEDWIKDGYNGIVAKDQSSLELGKTLQKLLSLSEEKLKEIKNNQRKFVLENLDIKIVVRKYIELVSK